MRYWIAILLFAVGCIASVQASILIEPFPAQEFNPSKGQTFTIPVKIESPGKIMAKFYTADGDLVRTLSSRVMNKAGTYNLVWDGKDESKKIVPNEAYLPVVELLSGEQVIASYDSRDSSGGKEIKLKSRVTNNKQIVFQLDKPSRILARAGVKSGPMMKSILHWKVRGKGRNLLMWDGFDHNKLINLYEGGNLALLVTGFELPNHSIVTLGNDKADYLDWRKEKKWPSNIPDLSQVKFERNGERISRHYYLPRSVDINPRISLDILDKLPLNKDGKPIVSGSVALKVNMNNDDRWAMQQSLYEVAFFVDSEFISEEEQGYVPLTWRWSPVGLKPGIHMITVNVSGFNGQVGIASIQIEIP